MGRGGGATFGGANAGAQALSAAALDLADGAIDVALVVAYDSLIEPETLVEMASRGAVTSASGAALAAPYDGAACGFVPGEARRGCCGYATGDARFCHLARGDVCRRRPSGTGRRRGRRSGGQRAITGALDRRRRRRRAAGLRSR